MEKVKSLFKGKAAGYYIVICDIILAIILGIVFFATYKGAMANNAASNLPEVIGVCILLGAVLDILTLVFPEYKFVHLFAIVAYCLSLMKEIYLIPNLIADQINGVAYQGGNFPLNLFYIIMQFVIIISAIVATFVGLLTKDGEKELNEKIQSEGRFSKKGVTKMVSGGVVGVLAIVAAVSTLAGISSNNTIGAGQQTVVLDDIQKSFEDQVIDYDFDPTTVIYKEDTHPYREATAEQIINNVSSSSDRFLHHKVYEFEGKYTEAYQGNFNFTYSYIYLWEDGLYNGTASGTNIYGYWYNRTAEGDTCLVLKDTAGNDMVCEASRGDPYYDWFGDLKSNVNGGRTFKMNGYMYYPVIGMFIDTGSDSLTYDFRGNFDKSKWTVKQIRNDLRYSAILNPDELEWTLPDTKVVGEQEVTVTWPKEELETSVKVTVGPDLGTYEFDFSSASVKKNYRYVDAFDPTGIICTRTLEDKEEIIPMDEVPYEFDYANNCIKFPMQNGETYTMPVTYDLSAASNTITGTINEKEVTVVLTSATTATISDGTDEVTVEVSLSGTGGLAKITIVGKTEGSDTLFEALPGEFSINESAEGDLEISLEKFMRSSSKANSYNQKTDTFFIFAEDYVIVIWQFDYNGLMNQWMKCSYTLNGNNITLNELIGTDSNNQWTWSSKTLYGLTDCDKGDLPFYPDYK